MSQISVSIDVSFGTNCLQLRLAMAAAAGLDVHLHPLDFASEHVKRRVTCCLSLYIYYRYLHICIEIYGFIIDIFKYVLEKYSL